MGPKKDPKRDAPKRDSNSLIDEPLNTDSWRCVVVMAVEKSTYDRFVIEGFAEEFAKGYRQEIAHIDFDNTLVKILTDFDSGNLPTKYASLMTFSSVLQEASEYVSRNVEIPVPILAKVVKAILFHMKEKSILRIEKYAAGPPNPIAAMAERPANFGPVETKKKEPAKKGDNAPKVRLPSYTKDDTKLLKRGEPVKDDQRIDDAPLNGYFKLYVLLTGFYQPGLPLELLKGGVPLHGLLCIDTSLSGVNPDITWSQSLKHKPNREEKALDIQNFWDVFLKILWDQKVSHHFKDTIFQVYIPRKMRCNETKLREFIYREISYLLYDLSEFKGQLNNYLQHMKLWDVEEHMFERAPMISLVPEDIPNECATVPVVLQCIIDYICGNESKYRLSLSSNATNLSGTESETSDRSITLSAKGWYGSCFLQPNWSQLLTLKGEFELLQIYRKIQELDYKYDLDNKYMILHSMDKITASNQDEGGTQCDYTFQPCGPNMEEALAADGSLRSYWKRYERHVGDPFIVDYCLYPLLMTRTICPFQGALPPLPPASTHSSRENSRLLIENISSQMRKPHFTVTESSRSILKALPYNVKDASKDFFSPYQFKIVSPEKLKASSAPQFRVGPHLKIDKSFTSQIITGEVAKNLFENLKDFLGEWLFSCANNFHFLEVLSKSQFLERKRLYWDSYNCVDHTYSIINDCLFVVLHNRMDAQNVHHETFNEALNTRVGLRDFYDYILEDKSEWFTSHNFSQVLTKSTTSSPEPPLLEFSDSDFVLINSIKYEQGLTVEKPNRKKSSNESGKSKTGIIEKHGGSGDMGEPISFDFEGYNVSDMAVQFSGLKTVYYSNDCNMTVELTERLYGNQDLGIHITAGGHTLHLYSYVCPEPHILDPFTFHVTYKNGVIVAFGRRFVETFAEIVEVIESKTAIRGKKNSPEMPTRHVKRLVPKLLRDEEFIYDMSASLPNGLSIKTVRKAVNPCYIKQQYLSTTDEITRTEKCRLFLPNGNIIIMLSDNTVKILKPDTSIITAALCDLKTKTDTGQIHFETFHYVSSEGLASTYHDDQPGPQQRYQVLSNTDIDTNQMYFRRRDGTNFMLQNDGSLCVEFKDGTKISSTPIEKEIKLEPATGDSESEEEMLGETFGEADTQDDFVAVYTRIVMEHPAYATVIYDSLTRKYNLLLPEDSAITIDPNGQYTVDLDKSAELKVEEWVVQMNKYSKRRRIECVATADLGVFENSEGGVYCHMEDVSGKIFIVEVNSNCYILDDDRKSDDSQESLEDSECQQSGLSEFIASADLQRSLSVHTERCSKLSRSNKYFAVRRDMTGFELLHTEDVNEILSEKKMGSLVYTETVPETDQRVFVLITPEEVKRIGKWQVGTILPNPTYVPNAAKRQISSTYGVPPSWMHPFPKRKKKFDIPELLSCRVFIEVRKTDLAPSAGELDCFFCEVDDLTKVQQISAEEMEDHLTKLADNDQDILKEMYAAVAESLINEKKKLKRNYSEKLEHYLNLSKYYVEQQEYHKRCIRYNTVPNYFHHPAGMSWLILNDIVEKMKIVESEIDVQEAPSPDVVIGSADKLSVHSKTVSEFSNEEIEYNLSHSDVSFSKLSYRSDISAHTAPAVLRTGGICRCKVSSTKDVVSSPVVKCYWQYEPSRSDIEIHQRECDFDKNEIETMKQRERESLPLTLDDLMCLGLI